MSSWLPLIFMALTSFLVLPGSALQGSKSDSVADLLLSDEIDKAEAALNKLARSAETVAFQGEIAFRRGDFVTAERLYRESVRMDEKSARGHFGLGKLALAKLKSKDAVSRFKRAVELAPQEALYHLYAGEAYGLEKRYSAQRAEMENYIRLHPPDPDRLAEAKAALEMIDQLGNDIGVMEAPDVPAPIPLQKTLNLIFTPVLVDGKGPYNFAVDTGATQVVLSEKLAAELTLKPITTTIMHGVGGGGKVDSKLFRVNELKLGDIKVKNLPVGTFNDPLVMQLADGIIGTAALADYIVTVNYPESRLELSKKAPAVTGGETIDAWYFNNLFLIPLDVNGRFHGNFIVDTGAVATVLSHSMAAKLGVTEDTVGAKIDLGIAGVGGMEGVVLRVPNVTFKTAKNTEAFPQVVSINLKEISKMIGTEISGVVGYDFLQGYKVVLNYDTAEVRLIR